MKRTLLWAVTATSACILLTGCNKQQAAENSATNDGKVKIELWHYFTSAQDTTLKELCQRFENAHPNVKVTPIYQGNPMQLSQKLSSSLAASPANNPAVATVYENWTSDYVAKNYLVPVEEFFDSPNGLSKEEQEDFVKVYRDANTYNGKWTTMPFNKSVYMLFYNAEMFEAAGYKEAPKTMEEFIDCVKKCTIREGGRTKQYGFGAMVAGEVFTTFYFASGGDFLTSDTQNVAFNTPLAQDVLNNIYGLQYPEKNIYAAAEYMTTPLANKQIASYIYSSAGLPFLEKQIGNRFRWAAAPIPGKAGTRGYQLMQGTNIGIFANKSDAEKKAAWDLVKFLTTKESAVYWATNSGYMPIRYSMLEDPTMKAYMEKNKSYKVAAEQVFNNKGKIEPTIAMWEGIRTNITDMVDLVISKGTPAADALAQTVKKTEAKLAGK